MKYFKRDEFKCKCCGSPFRQARGELASPEIVSNIEALVEHVLDPARESYGGPIYVNSGYRCKRHNAEVGGVVRSQHLCGEAADVHCADNKLLLKIIKELDNFDQLIVYPTFIHVSYKRKGGNRRQLIVKS